MISDLHNCFDKLKKEIGVLSGVLPVKAVVAPATRAPAVMPKGLAVKGIKPDIALNKDEEEQNKEKQKANKKKKNQKQNKKSAQASSLSPQMARLIRWNIPGLYQHKAHRLFKI